MPRPNPTMARRPLRVRYQHSGFMDGPDWDLAEAYKGGMTPDWSQPDPFVTGKGSKTLPFKPQ